jgi:ABC-type branched-subunit amino acid transport system ATPase component
MLSHIVVNERTLRAERAARARVAGVVEMLGLGDVAERPAAGLSLGTLRMVEIGRALVTGAKLIMLDEPASGLDNAETDLLAAHLQAIREDQGVSILLIEHDVRMVTAVSDYMYVIEQGRPLAEGPPERVQRDASVIATYLGDVPAAEAVV